MDVRQIHFNIIGLSPMVKNLQSCILDFYDSSDLSLNSTGAVDF